MAFPIAPTTMTTVAPLRMSTAPRRFAALTTAPTLPPDQYTGPKVPPPPTTTTPPRSFWDRISPKELAAGIALHVGGGALIAGGIGAGIAALAGGTVLTGLAIGAGIGAVLGGAFLTAVLLMAG